MSSDLLKKIYESTLEFLRPLSLEERYKIAVEEAIKVVGAEYGTIFLGDENGDLIRVYSNVPLRRQATPRRNGFTHKALIHSKLYVVTPEVLKKVHKKELYDKGVHSLILIPLSFNKETVGVLSLQARNARKMTPVDTNALNLFGSLISLGIRNSQLYEITRDAVEARDLFISLASHELKTPLTTISAYSEQIARRLNSHELPSEKSVTVLNSEIKRLKHMLNELLAIDQIKSGQLRYSWKDVKIISIVKRAIINFKFSYPGYKVFVENSLNPPSYAMQGDAEKLQQVLTNLLNNSAKFSSKITPIVISMWMEDESVNISITDYGKGIRKKEQNKVFTEFFKAEGNRKEGMGLGLYLVKNIIEEHHGSVILKSKLHKGTTITLKFPQKLYD